MTIVAWVLVAVGAYLIAANYWALAANRANRRKGVDRHYSFVPLLGGFLCAVGLYLVTQSRLAFAVALLDPGVWVLASLPVALLRELKARQNEDSD